VGRCLGHGMKHAFLNGALACFALLSIRPAVAADLGTMPVKALPAPASFDWTGFYIGGHFGYATGTSDWSASQGGGAAPLNGSIDLFNSFDAFKGTGSYFAGLQAGYNRMLPSHWLLGVEMDFSAPNTVQGSQTVSSAANGQASYTDTVLDFGTLRGRVGYAFDRWLVYGTGGVAWTYDKLERTQLAGMPVGGDGAGRQAPGWKFRSRRTGAPSSNFSPPNSETARKVFLWRVRRSRPTCRCRVSCSA
jgi:high affinity Mn2+ porin